MIYLFSGTPGSGKSLDVAKAILEQIKNGRPCIGNFEINYEKIKGRKKGEFTYIDNYEMTPDKLIQYSREVFKNKPRIREDYILLVIDECQLLFNARDWNIRGRNEWLSFFTQHRKFGYKIILVAQFDRMVDRQIRSLIEYEYVHRKVSNYGIGGLILSSVLGGGMFVSVQIWYPLKEKVGSKWFKCRKSLYSLYDTYNMFSMTDGVGVGGLHESGTGEVLSDSLLDNTNT